MKGLLEALKRVAIISLAAVIIVNSYPVTVFASEIDRTASNEEAPEEEEQEKGSEEPEEEGGFPEESNPSVSMVTEAQEKEMLEAVGNEITVMGVEPDSALESIGSISYNDTLDAYEINSADNLHDLAVYVNGSGTYTTGVDETTAHDCAGLTFKMTGNIALTHTTEWNNAASTENNYTAIGNGSPPFKGTFDGQNYTVSGIRIYKTGNGTDAIRQGLFGVVRDGGTVKDVVVSDVRIQGSSNIGAVVGLAWPNATVSGCVVADAFLADGGGGYVGGVVGNANAAAVSDCHVYETVTIHAAARASSHGGVVGDVSSSGSITGCTSAATLTIADGIAGCKYFGGIVGHSSNASVANCRAVGVTVPATSYNSNDTSGAIAGDVRDSTLTDNYYLNCTVSDTPNAVDIGVGYNENGSGHRNNGTYSLHTITLDAGLSVSGTNVTIGSVPYYPGGETITLGSGGCTVTVDGSDPVQYVQISETAGVYIFTMPSGNVTVSGPPDYAGLWHADVDHDGATEARAYVITTPAGLNLLASEVNNGNSYSGKFFKLGADITYAHTTDWNDAGSTENNYVAIGNAKCNFCGTFDGCGYTVSGIRICKSAKSNQGLFGFIRQAAVKNVTLTDARITGDVNAGGIAGRSAGGTVSDCTVTGTVAIHAALDNTNYHGGIVGYNSPDSLSATVTGCTSSAKLTMADGLTKCWSWGGVVGQNNGSGAVVENCFAAGVTIEGLGLRGAVVGSNEERQGTTIGTLIGNYYTGCTVGGRATGIGAGLTIEAGGAEDQDGARCVGRITLGDGVTVTDNYITVNTVKYGLVGRTISLCYSGSAPEGYSFDGYSVKDAADKEVEVKETDGLYQFIMPASDVTVSATFKELISQTITASAVTATYGDTGVRVSAESNGDGTISYAVKSGDAVTVDAYSGALTILKAGIATITVTASGTATYKQATKDVCVTVNKANPTMTAPTAKTLTYTSSTQVLVTAGEADGGTMHYAVTTTDTAPADNLYSTTIPTGTNAGTYYVWYKVKGDANHNDVAAASVEINIAKNTAPGSKTLESAVEVQIGPAVETKVNIKQYIGDGATLTSSAPSSTDNKITFTDISLSADGDLSFKTDCSEVGNGQIVLTLASNNYDGYKLTIPVTIKAKTTQVELEHTPGVTTDVTGVEVKGLSDYTNNQDGSNVQVVLDVKPEDTPSDKTIKNKIENVVKQIFSGIDDNNIKKEYFDISVKKTVDGDITTVTDVEHVIEIVVTYNLTGKYNPVVVREHNGSVARFTALDSKPESGFKDGTYYVDTFEGKIYIYTQYFSTYIIAYTTAVSYTVTFNANGGISVDSIVVTEGGKIGTLPTPTRSGYSLNGWYTESNGGTKISSETPVTRDVTYYAQWTANSSGGGGSGDSDSGTVTSPSTTLEIKQKQNISSYLGTTYKKYQYSQKGIVYISSKGVITAKKAGTVKVTGCVKQGKSWVASGSSVTLTVEKPYFAEKTLQASYAGQKLYAANNLKGVSQKPSSWRSSKSSVASVDPATGEITVNKGGSTKITAVFGSGSYAAKYSFTLKVRVPKISRATAAILTGGSIKLKMKNTDKPVTWSSSNSNIAEVSGAGTATVTGKNAGQATITVTVEGQKYDCTVTVRPPAIRKATMTVRVGKQARVRLKNTKLPAYQIKWSSNNTSVARVDASGYVTGVAPGTAVISTTTGGVTSSCTVTVRQ